MDWKAEAIEKLRQYEAKRQALAIIPKQIAKIDSTMTNIRSSRTDATPVKGGSNSREDLLLNCIMQKEELRRCLEHTKSWMEIVDGGLAILDEEERRLLDGFYLIEEKGAAQRLASEFFADVKTIYRRKDNALRKFTLALYGCMEC